jgi:uncharacterized protein
MGNGSNVEKLVLRIVNSLVDNLDDVRVTSIITGTGTIFEVSVAPSDVGKIIGKSGRTARAIRELLMAMGIAAKVRYGLDVIENRESADHRIVANTTLNETRV